MMEALEEIFNADKIILQRKASLDRARGKGQAADEAIILAGHKLEKDKADVELRRAEIIARYHTELEAIDTEIEGLHRAFGKVFDVRIREKRNALRSIRLHDKAIGKRKEHLIQRERDKARRVVARKMGL